MRIRATALGIVAAALVETAAAGAAATPRAYSRAVEAVCAGALLFNGSYPIGTRAGAVAVSRAIRRTGRDRLRHVESLRTPPGEARLVTRWIAVQRRLVEVYAASYLDVWVAIERAHTPRQHAMLPRRLAALLDRPRALEKSARKLERQLDVPDCTGGIESSARPSSPPV